MGFKLIFIVFIQPYFLFFRLLFREANDWIEVNHFRFIQWHLKSLLRFSGTRHRHDIPRRIITLQNTFFSILTDLLYAGGTFFFFGASTLRGSLFHADWP